VCVCVCVCVRVCVCVCPSSLITCVCVFSTWVFEWARLHVGVLDGGVGGGGLRRGGGEESSNIRLDNSAKTLEIPRHNKSVYN